MLHAHLVQVAALDGPHPERLQDLERRRAVHGDRDALRDERGPRAGGPRRLVVLVVREPVRAHRGGLLQQQPEVVAEAAEGLDEERRHLDAGALRARVIAALAGDVARARARVEGSR